jgi:nucleotide-binding universal stress UspA family protein
MRAWQDAMASHSPGLAWLAPVGGRSISVEAKDQVMTEENPAGPVLFCFDGSEGSLSALRAAGQLLSRPVEAVVLTVWETIETQLALAGGFAAGFPFDSADLDADEETSARSVAEEGARRASEHGYKATPMVRQSYQGVVKTILETADELSVRVIVCGQRGRGTLRTALLGSVSHALASHTRHPVLIAPEIQAGSK